MAPLDWKAAADDVARDVFQSRPAADGLRPKTPREVQAGDAHTVAELAHHGGRVSQCWCRTCQPEAARCLPRCRWTWATPTVMRCMRCGRLKRAER